MLFRRRAWKLMASGTGWLRHSPVEHRVMFPQRLIVEIKHRHRAVVADVEPRIQRAVTERALFDGNTGEPDLPGDECLAITTIYPCAGIGEVVGNRMLIRAFRAHDDAARARHGEVGVVRQAVDFYYI